MKNVHVLPTDKPSRLLYFGTSKELTLQSNPITFRVFERSTQNIYITSDEEIKEGDWFLTPTNDLRCANIEWRITISQFIPKTDFKKIILTDNQDLIKGGVQAIDDEFLEWFVKNPSCEEVELANSLVRISSFNWRTDYKIIIPKEKVLLQSSIDGEVIWGEPKQETLEEVAEKWNEKQTTLEFGKPHNAPNRIKAFIEGAKWQQQQTIEEVFEWLTTNNYLTDLKKTLIEQFKKK